MRLLDLVDVHFYPQGQVDGQGVYGSRAKSPAMRALRLRSTQGLWDQSYQDESWIKDPVALIPRVRAWVEQHNPGTKLCIGEYNWGGDDDPSGAVAQAEILGILARERVDYAYFWAGLEGVQRYAFQLYRNPDGHNSGFGNRYLDSHSDDADHLSVFAAARDDGGAHGRPGQQGPRPSRHGAPEPWLQRPDRRHPVPPPEPSGPNSPRSHQGQRSRRLDQRARAFGRDAGRALRRHFRI